ncbi:MAG: N-acetylmuramoyl-L-alanine amidase [Luteolibacter sp.]
MKTLLKFLSLATLCVFGATGLQAANFRTVVIDPGHGGHDNGGQWGRVYEKHLALDTSARIEYHLRKMGFNTVLTRRSDYFISLPQRVSIANRYKNAIFVSVHYNSTTSTRVNGLETFYHTPQSERLAQYVHRSMMQYTKVENRGVKTARFYVIRNTKIPSILIEGGFVSCSNERERLKSGWYREALARGVADGIRRYRNSSN